MWRGLLVVGVGIVGWFAGRAVPTGRAAPPAAPAPCPDRLAAATRALEAGEAARAGRPREFPPGVPAAFTAGGFERAVRDVVAACPEAGMDVERVDCSEFPCAVVLAHREVASAAALRACPAWHAAFGALGRDADDVTLTPGGPRAWTLAIAWPVGAPYGENDATRWETRGANLRADLEAAWDGRPLSALEQTDWQIAKARRAGDEAAVEGLLDLRRALELE